MVNSTLHLGMVSNCSLSPHVDLTISYFLNVKFVRVYSLVSRYFCNMYLVKKSLKLCFPLMLRTMIYFHVYIILDFLIIYRNVPVLSQNAHVYIKQ